MLYRAQSNTGDYTFGFGRACFLSGREAVAQAIKTKLKLFQGDFWEDTSDGLPFFQEIAGQKDKATIDLLFQARVLQTPEVASIASFTSELGADRRYTATMTVTTNTGETVEVTI
jgi:hypothetical protein